MECTPTASGAMELLALGTRLAVDAAWYGDTSLVTLARQAREHGGHLTIRVAHQPIAALLAVAEAGRDAVTLDIRTTNSDVDG